MARTVRWLIFLVILISSVAFAGSRRFSVQAAQVTAERGALQINGNIRLDLTLAPEIVQPGDAPDLQIILVNQSQLTQIPEINVQLPAGLSLRSGALLPGGMTLNVAAHQLNWLPVLTASGGRQEITLPLRVETADIRQPEQPIRVTLRQNGVETTAETTVWVGTPPQVSSIVIPSQVAVGQPFALRAEAGGSGPFTHAWDLGDGRRVNVNEPTVVYPAVGQYQITVTTSNPLADASRSRQITVVPHPAAQFTADDFTPSANQPVSFINQSGGQPPLRTVWEFGDGAGSEENSPTHQYAAPGVYQVRLQVSNDYGTAEAAWTVTVGAPPTAELTLPQTAAAGQPFTAQAAGDPSVTLYTWNMGDGQMHEGAQISHTYRTPGDYYVTLTASNEYGNVSLGGWVQVEGGFFVTYLPFLFKSNYAPDNLDGDALAGITPALPDVPLDEPFELPPLDLPANLSPMEQLFAAINVARQQFDLAPLTLVPALSVAAQQHTGDMAAFAYTGHVGSDGSTPAERLLRFGYPAGYAGEATAWGYERPSQAVEFWVNSPPHRRIILNEFATDVGVGYTQDFSAPNVWYWTAEFGNAFAAPIAAALRLRGPQPGSEWLNTDVVRYAWNWPAPLADGQAFVVKMDVSGEEVTLGLVNQARNGAYYVLETDALALTQAVGAATWWVELSDGRQTVAALPPQPITLVADPTLPTPTPALTPTAVAPTPTVTPTPTPTEAPPQSATRPPATPLPPLVTATPNP